MRAICGRSPCPCGVSPKKWGTPCFVYSRRRIEDNWREYDQAFNGYPHEICYAVKANGNLGVLGVLAALGSGFDIVSWGEFCRVEKAGGAPANVVFSGVGKSADEIRLALRAKVGCIDIESMEELQRVANIANETGCEAPIALRVNPDVDAETHPYIATGLKTAKFGVDIDRALEFYRIAAEMPGIRVLGVACHIGSQIMDTAPLLESFKRLLDLAKTLHAEGISLEHIDVGGGLGVDYKSGDSPGRPGFVKALIEIMDAYSLGLQIKMEPGRSIVGDAGVLLSTVEYLKHTAGRNFAVLDAGMNDMIRPALYQAWHDIVPVAEPGERTEVYDVVGPVCETADVLGYQRELSIEPGGLVAVKDAGAYCAAMASNYNGRRRPAEVMVDGSRLHVVRQRETFEEMFAQEALINSF